MSVIVQKYGGTSVGDLARIRNVAKRVAAGHDAGNKMVVVLSAMAGVTDQLIRMAKELTDRPNRRELDALMATGEQTTVSLMAITLESMGYKAVSLLGYQVELRTDSAFGTAKILDIDGGRISRHLDEGRIVIVAGFQGTDAEGNITTLGRGGSDTSAVAIAAAIKADTCEIFTDVDGVYTADPNVVKKARKLSTISYDAMLEMAGMGAKVLHLRSVEFAKKFNVPVHVRSSFNQEEGTMVIEESRNMEALLVEGVTQDKNQARITITKVPDKPGIASKIFQAVGEAGISVDMIIQNTRAENLTDVTFTVPQKDLAEALEIEKKVAAEIGALSVTGDENIAKVSITGVGMRSHSGVAAMMFSALAAEGINILMISTSEIRISCVVEQKYSELAMTVLHKTFGLDAH